MIWSQVKARGKPIKPRPIDAYVRVQKQVIVGKRSNAFI